MVNFISSNFGESPTSHERTHFTVWSLDSEVDRMNLKTMVVSLKNDPSEKKGVSNRPHCKSSSQRSNGQRNGWNRSVAL